MANGVDLPCLKKIGCGRSLQEIAALKERARLELSKYEKPDLIVSKDDCFIESFVSTFSNNQLRIAGPELIPGKIYDGTVINKETGRRLIVSFSSKRAKKDEYNRKRGLKRLEKSIKSGKLTKSKINKRGYNKYLRLEGEVKIEINYEKFEQDAQWDGLKGYLTNTTLTAQEVIENYSCLWHIERAFRISKTDLLIRPIYHRLGHRIEAHKCISFVAYTICKELECNLKIGKCTFSSKGAIELTKKMYQISFTLPDTILPQNLILKTDDEQQLINSILNRFY